MGNGHKIGFYLVFDSLPTPTPIHHQLYLQCNKLQGWVAIDSLCKLQLEHKIIIVFHNFFGVSGRYVVIILE